MILSLVIWREGPLLPGPLLLAGKLKSWVSLVPFTPAVWSTLLIQTVLPLISWTLVKHTASYHSSHNCHLLALYSRRPMGRKFLAGENSSTP